MVDLARRWAILELDRWSQSEVTLRCVRLRYPQRATARVHDGNDDTTDTDEAPARPPLDPKAADAQPGGRPGARGSSVVRDLGTSNGAAPDADLLVAPSIARAAAPATKPARAIIMMLVGASCRWWTSTSRSALGEIQRRPPAQAALHFAPSNAGWGGPFLIVMTLLIRWCNRRQQDDKFFESKSQAVASPTIHHRLSSLDGADPAGSPVSNPRP